MKLMLHRIQNIGNISNGLRTFVLSQQFSLSIANKKNTLFRRQSTQPLFMVHVSVKLNTSTKEFSFMFCDSPCYYSLDASFSLNTASSYIVRRNNLYATIFSFGECILIIMTIITTLHDITQRIDDVYHYVWVGCVVYPPFSRARPHRCRCRFIVVIVIHVSILISDCLASMMTNTHVTTHKPEPLWLFLSLDCYLRQPPFLLLPVLSFSAPRLFVSFHVSHFRI